MTTPPSSYPELAEYFLDLRPPLEAQIIDLADEIAYLTADLEDGLDSGILTLSGVCEGVSLFRRFHDIAVREYPKIIRARCSSTRHCGACSTLSSLT